MQGPAFLNSSATLGITENTAIPQSILKSNPFNIPVAKFSVCSPSSFLELCFSLYWGQFCERLAAGSDQWWALPLLVRPRGIKSVSTKAAVIQKGKKHWRLPETGDLELSNFIHCTNSCQHQNKIYMTSPCCSWHGEFHETRHIILHSLKSSSSIFSLSKFELHAVSYCIVFSFVKLLPPGRVATYTALYTVYRTLHTTLQRYGALILSVFPLYYALPFSSRSPLQGLTSVILS